MTRSGNDLALPLRCWENPGFGIDNHGILLSYSLPWVGVNRLAETTTRTGPRTKNNWSITLAP